MKKVTYEGLSAYVPAYACRWGGQIIYLSLIGTRTAVRAIWAAVLEGRLIEYDESDWFRRIEDAAYRTEMVALPESGATHFVMLNQQATCSPVHGQPFYVLKEKGDDEARVMKRFVAALDHATGVPLMPAWGKTLWQMGLGESLIEACEDVLGIEAWCVDAQDSLWLDLIKAGIQAGRLK